MNATARLGGIKQSVSTFWEARDRRERRMLLGALVVIMLALFYLLLIDPALSGRTDLEKRLPVLRQQAAEVQGMAKEAGSLAGDNAAAVPPLTRESLESSLNARGLKAKNVSVSGELAKVQLEAVSFAGMVDWLDELQKASRVVVVDAGVEAQAQNDVVNANLTLRQQRTE